MASRRTKPLFRYRLTRLGFHFLFVALFAIIGGSLRGFNLLLLLAGLLTSILIVQWRQGRGVIRRVRVERYGAAATFAGVPVSIRYVVHNTAKWFPIWSIRIEDRLSPRVVPATLPRDVHVGSAGIGGRDDDSNDLRPIPLLGSVGQVPAGRTGQTVICCRFGQRGVYRLGPIIASTSYPFCLLNSERLSWAPGRDIHVFPSLFSLRRGWEKLLPSRRGGSGNRSVNGTNLDGEFFGLRPWQSGDQLKHIHWRTTARIGEPAVRQFEQRTRNQLCVVVDFAGDPRERELREQFETILSLAATLIDAIASPTQPVGLFVPRPFRPGDHDGNRMETSRGPDVTTLMKQLSVAQLSDNAEGVEDWVDQRFEETSTRLETGDVIVVSNRELGAAINPADRDLIPGSIGSMLTHLHRTRRLSWLDVRSAKVARFVNFDQDPASDVAETDRVEYVRG